MKYAYDSWWFFSKSEKKAFRFLLLLMVLTNLVHFYLVNFSISAPLAKVGFDTVGIQAISHREENALKKHLAITQMKHIAEPFNFDPNQLDSMSWLRLGLEPFSIKTIMNYKRKGGRFRKPEDLLKIYGMPAELASKWMPYVSIPQENTAEEIKSLHKNNKYKKLDINRADSVQWLALPMIGPTLSGRIVSFREKLGGFYSVHQIREVYGMKDSVFTLISSRLEITEGPYRFLQINKASEEEMKRHPYIRYTLARSIARYREQHGIFKNPEDLLRIKTLDSGSFVRLRPYLHFN